MAKILMIIANNWFQDYEFGVPFDIFHNAWIDITVWAGKKWECVWVFWSKTVADLDLDGVIASEYDMVIFVWWWWAYSQYFHDEKYLKIAKKANKIWAICIAPMILSESGIFIGKSVTSWDKNWVQKKFIQDNWWFWVDKNVVVSGNIVTANGPDAAAEFANKCLELI